MRENYGHKITNFFLLLYMDRIWALDVYQTAGVGVLALLVGIYLTRCLKFLKKFCIPAPVTGGLIFSLLTLGLYHMGIECSFDGTIKDICMMLFFTSVGFQSDFKVLKKGGKPLLVMIGLVFGLIVCQNLISVGMARGMGLQALFGMSAGSIPMCGGHGTAGGFAPLLAKMGLEGADSITMAAATFGLVAGSLLGGPLAEKLIRKHNLADPSAPKSVMEGIEGVEASPEAKLTSTNQEEDFQTYVMGACYLFFAMALGTGVSKLLQLTGITFPTYFGALLVACFLRNVMGLSPKLLRGFPVDKIVYLGDISLQLFLGIAMASLQLWQLASLALPLGAILCAQVAFMALFGAFVAFPLLGKNYDSAVLVSGLCGFGLGATPNAMANMSAVCYKYRYAVQPFVIVPIIGAMFVDLINTGVITVFLNLI